MSAVRFSSFGFLLCGALTGVAGCLSVETFKDAAYQTPPAVAAQTKGLHHRGVMWVSTKTEMLPDPAQDDPYRPGKKLPQDPKKKPQITRLVMFKEFDDDLAADKFIHDAPEDVKPHMQKIDEDR